MQRAPQLGFRCHAKACPLSLRGIVLSNAGRCPLCGGALQSLDGEDATQVEPLSEVAELTEVRRRKMPRVACRARDEVRIRSLGFASLPLARLVAPGVAERLTHHWIWNCPFRIGRGGQADLMLGGEKISRLHAQIVVRGGVYVLEDLDSANGTFVNGERVKTHTLVDGDKIRVGGTGMVFVVSG